jgi:gamma-glutamyltranspeptidase/glutathione hydrolase
VKGAVAAGSPLTVQAGLTALDLGGNAVDAAIAASLMAGVAEPLLTGLGGAGMAMIRMNGEVQTCDLFANIPGLDAPDSAPAPMDEITIDFGPTRQSFRIGCGAAAVPGVPAGLCAMHKEHGLLSLSQLAQPAADAARTGVEVLPGFERVCELLWPILESTKAARELLGRGGRPLRAGDIFRNPDLASTLEAFGREGEDYFRVGPGAQALTGFLSGRSRLGPRDLAEQRAHLRPAMSLTYQDATVWVPGPPSAAGYAVLQMLSGLQARPIEQDPSGPEAIANIRSAMAKIDGFRSEDFFSEMFSEGFADRVQQALQAGQGIPSVGPGLTTHISTVDETGGAVSITHSLGETCGEIVPGTGVLVNNFLGEGDVNPPGLDRAPGRRLITMCCPSMIERGDEIFALGSGGSSRIPTAILHGTLYLIDHALSVSETVAAPRTHLEAGTLHVESDGRQEATMQTAQSTWPDLIRFDGPNMFFGGLHMVGHTADGFTGSGDHRRSGAYGVARGSNT